MLVRLHSAVSRCNDISSLHHGGIGCLLQSVSPFPFEPSQGDRHGKEKALVVYLPADVLLGIRERVVSLIETDDLVDVSLQLVAAPGSIALELYANDKAEQPANCASLDSHDQKWRADPLGATRLSNKKGDD